MATRVIERCGADALDKIASLWHAQPGAFLLLAREDMSRRVECVGPETPNNS